MPDTPMSEIPMSEIKDNPAQCRFELVVDGRIAFVVYRRQPPSILLLHAEVPPELEGRGIGSKLVAATLDALRQESLDESLKVVPRCPFIAAFIRKHPAYADMLA